MRPPEIDIGRDIFLAVSASGAVEADVRQRRVGHFGRCVQRAVQPEVGDAEAGDVAEGDLIVRPPSRPSASENPAALPVAVGIPAVVVGASTLT